MAEASSVATQSMPRETDYESWSHKALIDRVTALESELQAQSSLFVIRSLATFPSDSPSRLAISSTPSEPPTSVEMSPHSDRFFDPVKYDTRFVALKLAYLGKNYNGYEHHAGHKKPLPTIEQKLWEALQKARLIFPQGVNLIKPGEIDWEGCEYSKCGRTDKGVSAFGQVIGIKVRSKRPLARKKRERASEAGNEDERSTVDEAAPEGHECSVEAPFPSLSTTPTSLIPRARENDITLANASDSALSDTPSFDPIADEIPYPQVLNRLLPPDIRVLAWCPSPPLDFSARFSCRERQYRYFFTQPAFLPIPEMLEHQDSSASPMKDGWLDIEAMRDAASRFEGKHDFRNFCKVDAKKQIENYERIIFRASIDEVHDNTEALAFLNQDDLMRPLNTKDVSYQNIPKVYTFTLHGSAFLWHQVRHMVAILFLVGQGLEKPELVSELLDIGKVPGRPAYEMATDTPLVLWDCIFPHEDDPERKDAMEWHYLGQRPDSGDLKYGNGAAGAGLMDGLWRGWKERKIDEVLAAQLIGLVAGQGSSKSRDMCLGPSAKNAAGRKKSQKVFDGGGGPKAQGRYTPVMRKTKLESVEVVNARFAKKKQLETSQAMKSDSFRRLKRENSVEDVDEGVE